MEKSKHIYRHIIKATSIFGGVQVFQILISLIRVKFISVFLGATGMGILAIYMSTLSMINSLSNYGLNFSLTREISLAEHENNIDRASKIYYAIKKWIIIFSILGGVLIIIFSKFLSKITFGNYEYNLGFIFLSITILLTGITNINNSVLQGMKRLKYLASSSVIGSALGLIASIPLYYFFGIEGIVPGIIITSISSFFISYFFFKKTSINKIRISLKNSYYEIRGMLNLVVIMLIAYVFGSTVTYMVNITVLTLGSTAELGLFNAGLSFSSQYISLIYISMTVDFFPRLSAISLDNEKVNKMVNQQAEIIYLILLPILIIIIIASPLIVKLFLTPEFNKIINFIRIMAIAIVFQALAYVVSNIPIAKNDKKIFFIFNSIIPGCSALIFSISGYFYFGLNGLAVGTILVNIIHFSTMNFICNKLYGFRMSYHLVLFFFITLLTTLVTFISIIYFPNIIGYGIGGVLLIFAILFSLFNLNKLMNIRELLVKYIPRLAEKSFVK